MRFMVLTVFFFCFVLASDVFALDEAVGNVKTFTGNVSMIRDNVSFQPKIGEKIYPADIFRTGSDGSLGVVFKDDTLLSLGPNSEAVVNEFLYSPAESKLALVLKVLKGTAVYVSGIIGKLAPETVRIETPVANIATRGTKFAIRVEGDDAISVRERK